MKQAANFLLPLALLLLLWLAPSPSYAQEFHSTNVADWYQPDSLQGRLQLWQSSPDSLTVFARVPPQFTSAEAPELQLLFFSRFDADRRAFDSLPLQPMPRQKEAHLLWATLPTSDSLRYLALEGRRSIAEERKVLAVAVLDPEQNFPPPSFYLSHGADSLPVMQPFSTTDSPLLLKGEDTIYTVFLYQKAFEAAAPPMSATPSSSNALVIDSVFQLPADSLFTLTTEGLYFIQRDTSRMSGKSIRITHPYFPEVGTLEDLSGPIRYISTREEWNRLKKSNFSKEAVDRFWLKIGKTEKRAKAIIKDYYDGVEVANRYFTNYKEGWKTDRGMIYLLYGAPDEVALSEGQEEWIYHKTVNNPEIKFTFVRVKNPFTDDHFVLIRDKEYTKAHYDTISQWRRGRKTL